VAALGTFDSLRPGSGVAGSGADRRFHPSVGAVRRLARLVLFRDRERKEKTMNLLLLVVVLLLLFGGGGYYWNSRRG